MRISKSGANLREQGALVNSAGLVVVLAVQDKKVACTHDDESRLISKHDISRREWTHSAVWWNQTAVWNQTAMFHQTATAIRTHPQTCPQCWIFSTVSNERRRPAHVLLVCARSTGAIKPLDQSCIPGRPKPLSQCPRSTQRGVVSLLPRARMPGTRQKNADVVREGFCVRTFPRQLCGVLARGEEWHS